MSSNALDRYKIAYLQGPWKRGKSGGGGCGQGRPKLTKYNIDH